MNRIVLWALALMTTALFGQKEGSYQGHLEAMGMQLQLNIHITKDSEGLYSGRFDSPQQGAFDIGFDSIHIQDERFEAFLSALSVVVNARFEQDSLLGVWTQNKMEIPLSLAKVEDTANLRPKRPQEPLGEPDYEVREVEFENKRDSIILRGTLTKPHGKGPFPAVVLVSGSGPQDRNSELLGHKPFLVISDYLSRNGIAVLRFDDRGTGESEGDFNGANSYDFSYDVEAAWDFLSAQSGINPKKTGILGHSEGGMIAPMVALRQKKVAFLVLVAAPGVPIRQLMNEQLERNMTTSGIDESEIEEILVFNDTLFHYLTSEKEYEKSKIGFEDYIKTYIKSSSEDSLDNVDEILARYKTYNSKWFHYFINFDPRENLEKLKSPVLALNGSKDVQVVAESNLEGIRQALDKAPVKQKHIAIHELENLNHLMQNATTGSVLEYAQIEETFSEEALSIITNFILEQ